MITVRELIDKLKGCPPETKLICEFFTEQYIRDAAKDCGVADPLDDEQLSEIERALQPIDKDGLEDAIA